MDSFEFEKQIGIETFFTDSKGLGGKLKYDPNDFIVDENFIYPDKKESGDYLIAEVSSRNWETNTLIREISNRLHVSRKRISFAGTKDKRAVTTQLMSFYKIPKENLRNLKIKDVKIKNIYESDTQIRLGDLKGNSFKIKIRNLEDTNKKDIETIKNQILKIKGFPNFYGYQRFGITRPVNHVIGKHIIKGEFEKAVMCYIGNPIKGEYEDIFELRKELEETRDYSYAFKKYPDYLIFEKSILNKLINNPLDFSGALLELPKNLLIMFINSYQSYLFNKILSRRILNKIPLNEAVIGDTIYPKNKNIIEERQIPVSSRNIDKVNTQIKKNKAVVTGVLYGYESQISEGIIGKIEGQVIKAEKIKKQEFIVPEIPFLSSRGSRRHILSQLDDIKYSLNKKSKELILEFKLDKGCYATSLLREFMKSNVISNY